MRLIIEVENKLKPYEITPNEFLAWAKADLDDRSNERRSIGNAVSNIKRSIHCWIDNYMSNLNITLCGNYPVSLNTYEKLKIIEPYGIKNSAIVKLLTNIRNEFEHNYQIIKRDEVEAFFETTELWLENVNRNYSINRIALILDAKTIREKDNNGEYEIEISKDAHIEYYWLSKKALYEFKNGNSIEKEYKDISYQELAKYLETKIKELYKQEKRITLTQTQATNTYKKLFKFKGSIHKLF